LNHGATGQGSNSAVAVAELFEGLGRELNDFAVVYLDGAIGGRLVLHGSYRRGVTGNAGDIGLMPVAPSRLKQTPPPGRPSDILLNRASVTGLVRHLRANGVTVASSRDFEAALETQSALVGEWLEDCAEALTNPLLSIAVLLDLRAIVIDGNLARPLIERLVAPLRALLITHVPEAREPTELKVGTIGRNAAVIGAATLPLYCSYGPDQDALFGS
jgi:predicted NBD/HSP70 family sugar kinase